MRRLLIAALVVVIVVLGLCGQAFAGGQLIYVNNDPASGVAQAEVEAALPAFQTAVTRDFAPIWGTDATLTTDPALEASAAMEISLLDWSPVFGALGFHQVFANRPTAYVFTGDATTYHEAWPLIFMHELFEMLADPWIDRVSQDPLTGRMWAVEVCDAVESGYYAYQIDGVPISDFVTPAWYGGRKGPVDFTRKLKRPHSVGRHGYAQYFDFGLRRWHTVLG